VVTWIRRLGPPTAAGLVALVALIAARAAMLPGLAFWDTAELQAVGPLLGTAHPPGLPTYAVLGWLASVVLQPFGDPAFRMNLFAGLCLAAAAGTTVDLGRALTGSSFLGILAGLGLALTPLAWSIGTHAEAHALHLVFVAALLRLLVAWESRVRGDVAGAADRWLIVTAIVAGLSVGNHSLTLLLGPPIALFIWTVDRETWRNTRLVSWCVVAFVATVVLVYLELPLRAGPFRAPLVYGRPETWDGFWYIALGEQFRGSLVNPLADLPATAVALVDRAVAQFGILAPLLPVAFVATWVRRRSYALLTGSAVLITCVFASAYLNAEIGRYYLGPVLMAWTWLAILAVVVVDAIRRVIDWLAGNEPDAHAAPSPWIAAVLLLVLVTPTLTSVQDRLAVVDESADRSATAWVDHVLGLMEPDAVIVSWWSYSTPLWYAQRVEGRRPDVGIIDDRTRLDENLGDITDVIDTHLGRNPVYVIRDDQREIELLAGRYDLEFIDGVDARSLTRVLGARGSSS
jgi:hypothetical protein